MKYSIRECEVSLPPRPLIPVGPNAADVVTKKLTVAYARVSSAAQDAEDAYGRAAQIRDVNTWAELNGVVIDKWVEDTITGATIHRKGIDAILLMARRGEIERLVIPRQDRFARNAMSAELLHQELESLGVKIVDVQVQFEANPFGQDAISGGVLRTLEGHNMSVNGCAFSPSGKWIVSASRDNVLIVWDAISGRALRTLKGHKDTVYGCAFSPSGEWIVSASSDDTLIVWDTISGRALRTLEGHKDGVYGCAFSPSGEWDRFGFI